MVTVFVGIRCCAWRMGWLGSGLEVRRPLSGCSEALVRLVLWWPAASGTDGKDSSRLAAAVEAQQSWVTAVTAEMRNQECRSGVSREGKCFAG